MIFWIFQIQLCIKVILLGTPAQKQRPKPREGAEKCLQDSLKEGFQKIGLVQKAKEGKASPEEESAKRMV